MLLTRATIAQQQSNSGLARNVLEEAKKIAPSNEQAFAMSVSLSRQTGDVQKALAETDEFLKRNPASETGKNPARRHAAPAKPQCRSETGNR